MSEPSQMHADQIAYWNGEGGMRWVAQQAGIETMLAPVAEAAIVHAAPSADAVVLDIGCGCGATTLALAKAVPDGRVTGLDVSAPILAVAKARGGDAANVTWLLADAATHAFPADAFDVMFSRFGVMFFGDPRAAFANLRRAARPGGRLVFACWRGLLENPWMAVPLRAAQVHVPPLPRPGPDDPGPFAFADPERVTGLLAGAGWAPPRFTPLDVALDIAGGKGLAGAIAQAAHIGAAARLLADQPEPVRSAALREIEAALAPYAAEDGRVVLPGAVWLVTSENA